MESIKKYWLWGIFISILSIFAMSHNANAAEVVFDISNYQTYRYLGNTQIECSFGGGIDKVLTGFWCGSTISGETILYDIRTVNTYSLNKGDLITFHIFIRSQTTNFNFGPILSYFGHSDSNFTLIDYHLIDDSNFANSSISYNGYVNPPPNNDMHIDFENYNGFYKIYSITLKSEKDQTSQIYLSGSNNNTAGLFVFNTIDSRQTVRFYMTNFTFYHYSESKENKEVEQKTQEAVDDSEAAGGSSSQDAQTGTTGLLNAITGAVSVISSASPTNCKINGNMGNLDMGQLDLCANPAPAFIQTIGSLILILMCVPLAISLFNRFIAIFRSFQS